MSVLNPSDTQYHFQVIDGWGGNLADGGIDDSVKPAAVHVYNKEAPTTTTPLELGACVYTTLEGGAKVGKIPLVDADVNLDADKRSPKQFWIVVEGNTQYQYSSLLSGQKVTLLRGHFTIETAHVKGSLSVGDPVCPEHGGAGTVDATLPHDSVGGNPGINRGRLQAAAAGDPIIGRVTNVKTVNSVSVYEIEMNC